MLQSLSLVTLGVTDLARSRAFYTGGFGWPPVFENDSIVFYQMNGFLLSTFLHAALEEDMGGRRLAPNGAFSLAHNVTTRDAVNDVVATLLSHGATLIRQPDEPPHGGYRGYVGDPDGHAWEIAWMPGIMPDADGFVRMEV
ncbi:VOC family protein [Maritimibacter sp. DP1N21-5]|uniref:VOC family protein n=1 Tax=Maritimibacter sp. DP1N21-5 TaxID=2836867 RepID=UPI001C46E200|nr:VOC family protein [Maritimibacter sp. DP1N21-5]MBV7407635.1 VOC family protein [Maritimibacter sp. DP1N21-5]